MDLQTLEQFLDHNVIPKIKKRPKTFLGIAKQPHYENVMSNIYAFYFNVNEVHNMHDLFINTLLEIINESKLGDQKKVNEIIDFDVDTEVSTMKGGRIDLLLSSQDHAIIIENKVYHTLNNDLQDYWNSTKVTNNKEENKIGIVLSLNKLSASHKDFINVTHLELLKRVVQNLGNYIMNAKDKYVVFLKDFYQNCINLSKSEMDNKELKFYFDNQIKIIEAKDFHFAVRTHITNQIEQVAGLIDDKVELLIPKGDLNKRIRSFQSSKNRNLLITVIFDKLITPERELTIIVKLENELLKNKEQYNAITFTEEEKSRVKPTFYTDQNLRWCHFAGQSYTLNEDQVSTLAQFIVEKLKEDGLLSIYRKLNDIIPKAKN
ncbi:PD-(D/E)XK nuclease family protein [Flavobacterium frigidarium]|uniref:PD-(D/E)XK nuclease family protein n=1 Tax=Flavobacterium frigidarium TaxID=99286 RepID=A0ABV4KCI6_9FLAO